MAGGAGAGEIAAADDVVGNGEVAEFFDALTSSAAVKAMTKRSRAVTGAVVLTGMASARDQADVVFGMGLLRWRGDETPVGSVTAIIRVLEVRAATRGIRKGLASLLSREPQSSV